MLPGPWLLWPLVILQWNRLEPTGLAELFVQLDDGVVGAVRVLFFEYSPDPSLPTLWIVGGMRADETFGGLQRTIYLGRSTMVKARTD